jgi:hypothetical protein
MVTKLFEVLKMRVVNAFADFVKTTESSGGVLFLVHYCTTI